MKKTWLISFLALATVPACGDNKNPGTRVDAAPGTVTPDASMGRAQAGEACEQSSDCDDLAPFCIDGVCCTSRCDGACEQCDLGDGECQASPVNSDPDDECGELDCSGFFDGWTGNSCFTRANILASEAACNGARACQTAEQLCSQPGDPDQVTTTCSATCQTPRAGDTCTGTTPGVCEGPDDLQEPNDSCDEVTTLPVLDGLSAGPQIRGQITPAGDIDVLEIIAQENDEECYSCNADLVETYFIYLDLWVFEGAGPITFCIGDRCGNETDCRTFSENSGDFLAIPVTSSCLLQSAHTLYLRATRQDGGSACGQYLLSYSMGTFCP